MTNEIETTILVILKQFEGLNKSIPNFSDHTNRKV